MEDIIKQLKVRPGQKVRLQDLDPSLSYIKGEDREELKEDAEDLLKENLKELAKAQELLWASDTYSILVILQGIDTAGKDGTIKHVFSGVNPQGCTVHSYKVPTPEELDHDFLWRYWRGLPERGRIGIFNRSYYEEVLVVRVHGSILDKQRIPGVDSKKLEPDFWKHRYAEINDYERHLVRNGTVVLKFFLNISKEEQARRFLDRIKDEDKWYKFSLGDLEERKYWDDYIDAFNDCLSNTSTDLAPWYIIPSDHKWLARMAVAEIITRTIEKLDLRLPSVAPEVKEGMQKAAVTLRSELGNDRPKKKKER